MSTKVRRRGQSSRPTSDNDEDPNNWPDLSTKGDPTTTTTTTTATATAATTTTTAIANARTKLNNNEDHDSRRGRSNRNRAPNYMNDDAESQSEEDEGVIRCICDYDFDDGFTIQCDDCLVWQHGVCVGISEDNVPKEYLCERCSPRWLDTKAARERQKKRYEHFQRRVREPRKRREQQSRANAATTGTGTLTNNNSSNNNSTTGTSRTRTETAAATTAAATATTMTTTTTATTTTAGDQVLPPLGVRSTSSGRSRSSVNVNNQLSDSDGGNMADIHPASPGVREHELEFTPLETSLYSACDDICRKLLSSCSESPNFDPAEPLTSHFELDQTALTTPQNPVPIRRGIFTRTKCHAIVRRIKSTRGNTSASRYALYARQDQPRGRHICELVGEVFPAKIYIDDRMNQYQLLGTVKQHVRLHPATPLCVDARHVGNDARFFRRSCRPNCVVRTVVLADMTDDEDPTLAIRLCAFAVRDIIRGEELTLGWEFSPGHICGSKVPDPSSAERGESESRRETRAAAYAHYLHWPIKMRRWLEAYRRGANAATSITTSTTTTAATSQKQTKPRRESTKSSQPVIDLFDDEVSEQSTLSSSDTRRNTTTAIITNKSNASSSSTNESGMANIDGKTLSTSCKPTGFSNLKKLWLNDYKTLAATADVSATSSPSNIPSSDNPSMMISDDTPTTIDTSKSTLPINDEPMEIISTTDTKPTDDTSVMVQDIDDTPSVTH
ncbi:hypothetical protein BDF22DRAFT_744854 [Syncephalis plumigaleata]|nr:hypothetical protein BDF22DRAFT_744854 [Syncephalis plumigaleata]